METPEALLRRLGTAPDKPFPLAEAALALASCEHPKLDLTPYRRHLAQLIEEVKRATAAPSAPDDPTSALRTVLAGHHRYLGDAETYDDLANADLIRVIDRRRGLPVSLGILYLHVARGQGWDAAGLAFPGHFLIRVDVAKHRTVLDPFAGGVICNSGRLRELLAHTDPAAELTPKHIQDVSDLAILLRLQNNLRSRLIGADKPEQAALVLERMLWLTPEDAVLWRDLGFLCLDLGRLAAAKGAFELAMLHARQASHRQEAAAALQRLKTQLN